MKQLVLLLIFGAVLGVVAVIGSASTTRAAIDYSDGNQLCDDYGRVNGHVDYEWGRKPPGSLTDRVREIYLEHELG